MRRISLRFRHRGSLSGNDCLVRRALAITDHHHPMPCLPWWHTLARQLSLHRSLCRTWRSSASYERYYEILASCCFSAAQRKAVFDWSYRRLTRVAWFFTHQRPLFDCQRSVSEKRLVNFASAARLRCIHSINFTALDSWSSIYRAFARSLARLAEARIILHHRSSCSAQSSFSRLLCSPRRRY